MIPELQISAISPLYFIPEIIYGAAYHGDPQAVFNNYDFS